MGYENGKVYWICPEGNTNVALSVRGDSQVSQNRDVFLYTKEDIGDQLWRIDVGSGFARIKSMLNESYALNIYLSTGNCDIHTWADNQEDSKINFRTIDAGNNLYRIQNYRNNADNNLYLTTSKASSGGLVTWNALNSGSSLQRWKLVEYQAGGGSTTGTLQYPVSFSGINGYFSPPGHTGVDFDCPCGTPVYAAAAGKIIFTKTWTPSEGTASWASMGNVIYMLHEGSPNLLTVYMHLREIDPSLAWVGREVSAGELFAYSGNTGKVSGVTGCHLHFTVIKNSDAFTENNIQAYHQGTMVDPLDYLP